MTYSYSTRSMFEGAPKRVASLLTPNLDNLVYFSDNETKLVSKIKNKIGKKVSRAVHLYLYLYHRRSKHWLPLYDRGEPAVDYK
jgi:hypothetical protein